MKGCQPTVKLSNKENIYFLIVVKLVLYFHLHLIRFRKIKKSFFAFFREEETDLYEDVKHFEENDEVPKNFDSKPSNKIFVRISQKNIKNLFKLPFLPK